MNGLALIIIFVAGEAIQNVCLHCLYGNDALGMAFRSG